MNFLAHIYLSGNDNQLMIGNFIADHVKGSDFKSYPPQVSNGIQLHRAIDTFTDHHPIFRQSKHRLHEVYGHYSGVLTDMFYDHFLASLWKNYHSKPLIVFVEDFYNLMQTTTIEIPDKTKRMVPHMIQGNWLCAYETVEGLRNILNQMDYRTRYRSGMKDGVDQLLNHYHDYQNEFEAFFEEMRIYVKDWLIQSANNS